MDEYIFNKIYLLNFIKIKYKNVSLPSKCIEHLNEFYVFFEKDENKNNPLVFSFYNNKGNVECYVKNQQGKQIDLTNEYYEYINNKNFEYLLM